MIVLSICIPFVGLILFIVWQSIRIKRLKAEKDVLETLVDDYFNKYYSAIQQLLDLESKLDNKIEKLKKK